MAQPIDVATVERIAKLARLRIQPEEAERYAHQLGDILNYVEQLQAVPTEGVEPLTHPVPIHDVLRDDEPRPSLPRDAALANAPSTKDGFFCVPKVLDDGGGA